MKNTIKLEIHKAIKNKLFVISVLLGCAITILSLIYQVNISSLDFAASGKNPMISAYTAFLVHGLEVMGILWVLLFIFLYFHC